MTSSSAIDKQRLREEREAGERAAAARERRVKRLKLLGLAFGVAAILVSALVLISQSGDGKPAPSSGGGGSAGTVAGSLDGIPENGAVLGDPKAPVTLIEFADLQCPYCGYVATQGALPAVIDRYVRTDKVKVELRLVSFLGPDSQRAATVAAAASEQDKLWQFADAFFANQGEENSGYVTDSFLRALTSKIDGLDAGAALSQADGARAKAIVTGWRREGNARDVNETPTFLLQHGDGKARKIKVQLDDVSSFSRPIEGALPR
jgi:protein-disulfide isomerase